MNSGDAPQSHFYEMSEETKKKAGIFGNNLYKLVMSVSVLTLLFNGGVWKQNVEVRTFNSAEERFEFMDQVNENTDDLKGIQKTVQITSEEVSQIKNNQESFGGDVQDILTAIEDLDKKVQWNFNHINNQ